MNRERPLVSVIVAVKNSERYLAEALESVIRTGYAPIEIVVVDDRSADRTAAIATSFAPVRFIQQEGRGLAAAWNTGVDAARGGLIAFIDSDDLWAADKLDLQVEYLAHHPDVQYGIAKMRFFLEEGCAVPPGFRAGLLGNALVGRVPGTLVARRSLFDALGGFDTRLTIATDVDWFARAKDAGVPMAIIPEVLLHKRVHAANLSANAQVNSRELLRLLKQSIVRQRGAQPTPRQTEPRNVE